MPLKTVSGLVNMVIYSAAFEDTRVPVLSDRWFDLLLNSNLIPGVLHETWTPMAVYQFLCKYFNDCIESIRHIETCLNLIPGPQYFFRRDL